MPIRVQLSRKKGWRMPPNTVKVSRPSKWGNPYRVDQWGQQQAVTMFRDYLKHWMWKASENALCLQELRGKNLACWCKPGQPCHADVLLELANVGGGRGRG